MPTPLPEHVARPEFAAAVRGYDRSQVDDYLSQIYEWLAASEERAAAAEGRGLSLSREVAELRGTVARLEERAGLAPLQSMATFAERMRDVMESAVDAADELRTGAEHEARERRDATRRECELLVEEAKREAGQIVASAHDRERAIEESIAALAERRTAALADLGRLHEHLAGLLAGPDDATRGEGQAGGSTGVTATSGSPDESVPPRGDERGGAEAGIDETVVMEALAEAGEPVRPAERAGGDDTTAVRIVPRPDPTGVHPAASDPTVEQPTVTPPPARRPGPPTKGPRSPRFG